MRVQWEWDKYASEDYNIVADFEATLMNLGVMDDFSDIEATEGFIKRHYEKKPKRINHARRQRLAWSNVLSD